MSRGTSLWPFVTSQHVVRPRKEELHHVRHGGQNGEALKEAATVQIAPYSFFFFFSQCVTLGLVSARVAPWLTSRVPVCVCAFLFNLNKLKKLEKC